VPNRHVTLDFLGLDPAALHKTYFCQILARAEARLFFFIFFRTLIHLRISQELLLFGSLWILSSEKPRHSAIAQKQLSSFRKVVSGSAKSGEDFLLAVLYHGFRISPMILIGRLFFFQTGSRLTSPSIK
jgi:hypothetical protein